MVMEESMAKKYYWLKLKDDFFNQKEIKKLRKIAGGDTYTIIYLKMQLQSIKKEGIITFDGTEKDLAEQLSLEIDEDVDNITIVLSYLKANNLIEELEESNYLLTKVPDCIGKEGSSAERVRRHRERKALKEKESKELLPENVTEALQCNVDVTDSNNEVTKSNTEKEKEKEKEKRYIYIAEAEEIYSLYPRKVGKKKAIDKIIKYLKAGTSKEELIKCVERYSKEVQGRKKEFIKNADTFFNGYYEDYLDCNYEESTNNNEYNKLKNFDDYID